MKNVCSRPEVYYKIIRLVLMPLCQCRTFVLDIWHLKVSTIYGVVGTIKLLAGTSCYQLLNPGVLSSLAAISNFMLHQGLILPTYIGESIR